MSRLSLNGLEFSARHGYFEQEKEHGNRFEVDLSLYLKPSKAGDTDDLEDTLDYAAAYKIVKSIMHGPSVNLIEYLANQIARRLYEEFDEAKKVEVSVKKYNPDLGGPCKYSEINVTWPA